MIESLSDARASHLREISDLASALATWRTRRTILSARLAGKTRRDVTATARSDLMDEVILAGVWEADENVHQASVEELLALLKVNQARVVALLENRCAAIHTEMERVSAQRQKLEEVGWWAPMQRAILLQTRQHFPLSWEEATSYEQDLWSDLFLAVVTRVLSQCEGELSCEWGEQAWATITAEVLSQLIAHLAKKIEMRERMLPSPATWHETMRDRVAAWYPLLPYVRIDHAATILAEVNGCALLEYQQEQGTTSLRLVAPHDSAHLVRLVRYEKVPLAFLRAMGEADVEWQGRPKTGVVGRVTDCFRQRVNGRTVSRGIAGVAKDDFSTSRQFCQEVLNATRASWLDRPLFLEIFPDSSWYVVPWYRLSPGYQSAGILCPVPSLSTNEDTPLTHNLVDCDDLDGLARRFYCVPGLMPELCRRLHNSWDFPTIRSEERSQDTVSRSCEVSQLSLW